MGTTSLKFCVFVLQILSGLSYIINHVEEVYKWTKVEHYPMIDVEEPNVGPYKYYIPENECIDGMEYHPASGLMLVIFSRIRPGIPLTLGAFCTDEYTSGSSPIIWEFPSPNSNKLRSSDYQYIRDKNGNVIPNPDLEESAQVLDDYVEIVDDSPRIVSVFQLTIDEKCNRAFFVDNGELFYHQNLIYFVQKPALVVIDLPVDGCQTRSFPIIRRVEFPDEIVAKGSIGFKEPILDYGEDSCDDLFVYIFNDFTYYLTVYNYKRDEFWTVDHKTFLPVISESYFDNATDTQLLFGPGIGNLGAPNEDGYKTFYYSPIASTATYSTSTKVLKDKSKSKEIDNMDDFRLIGYRGCNHQAMKTTLDTTYNTMFFSEYKSRQIRCWNINKTLNPDNMGVVFESESFGMGTHIFIDSLGYLWFLHSPLPHTYTMDLPLNLDEINTRIFRVKVSDAINGTVCEESQDHN